MRQTNRRLIRSAALSGIGWFGLRACTRAWLQNRALNLEGLRRQRECTQRICGTYAYQNANGRRSNAKCGSPGTIVTRGMKRLSRRALDELSALQASMQALSTQRRAALRMLIASRHCTTVASQKEFWL